MAEARRMRMLHAALGCWQRRVAHRGAKRAAAALVSPYMASIHVSLLLVAMSPAHALHARVPVCQKLRLQHAGTPASPGMRACAAARHCGPEAGSDGGPHRAQHHLRGPGYAHHGRPALRTAYPGQGPVQATGALASSTPSTVSLSLSLRILLMCLTSFNDGSLLCLIGTLFWGGRRC